jgi:hypothetical protein
MKTCNGCLLSSVLSCGRGEDAADFPDEASALQNRWLVATASMLIVVIGIVLAFASNEPAFKYLKENESWVGLILAICGFVGVVLVSRRNKRA